MHVKTAFGGSGSGHKVQVSSTEDYQEVAGFREAIEGGDMQQELALEKKRTQRKQYQVSHRDTRSSMKISEHK